MRNVVMLRREPGLVSIPVENAVYGELWNSLDIIRAALRTLRIGGHCSIGSPDSRFVESEPGPTAVVAAWRLRVIRGDTGVYGE